MDKKISPFGAAAHKYAEKFNWPVFPTSSISGDRKSIKGVPGKTPLIKDWVEKASVDPEQIKTWNDMFPGANVSVITGEKSGLFVMDFDIKDNVNGIESLKALEKVYGTLPATVTQVTGGGGIQMFFKYPTGKGLTKGSCGVIGPGIDLRTDGNQVVLPPSLHISGNRYKWKAGHAPGEIELAELPPAWIEFLAGGKKGKHTDASSRTTFSIPDIIPNHTRNNFAFSMGRSFLSKNLSYETAVAAVWAELQARAESMENITYDEIAKTVQSAYSKTPGINEETDPEDEEYNSVYRNASAPYRVVKGCTKQVKHNGDGTKEYKEIANFVAVPRMDIIKDDGRSRERCFIIEGRLSDGTPLDPVTVSSIKFPSMNWITEWGLDAIISPVNGTEKALRNAIQLLAKAKAQKKTVYTHTGWRNIQGKWAYLYHGGTIGADNVSVELEGALTRYTLPDPVTNYREAASMSLKTLDIGPHSTTIPLLAFTYLSVLNEFFRQAGDEPSFTLWLLAKSGAGKSSIAAIFLSHFGQGFSRGTLPCSFRDTQNNLEKISFLCKDMLLVIDDYCPVTTRQEKQKMEALAQGIMRQYGDRRGRGRMANDTSLREAFVPRGNAIITSEDIPSVGQSGTARYIAVEFDREDIKWHTVSHIQENKALLALSMRGFIEWIIATYIENFHANNDGMGKDFPDLLGQIFRTRRQSILEKATHGRAPEQVAWLTIAFGLALEYFKHVGAISEEQDAELMAKGEEVLLNVIAAHDAKTRDDSPAVLFLKAMEELIATQKCQIWDTGNGMPDVGDGTISGYYDNDYVYLRSDTCFNDVYQFYSKRGEVFPVSKKTLFKHLANEGHIHTKLEGTVLRYEPGKKIYKSLKRLLWVKRESLPLA